MNKVDVGLQQAQFLKGQGGRGQNGGFVWRYLGPLEYSSTMSLD